MRKPEEIATQFHHTDELTSVKSFFLVGIGGAGMSALARMLFVRNHLVRGTDSSDSIEIARLRAEGIECWIGHSGNELTSQDALVVSDAIDLSTSPEVAKARELRIPIVRRSQALGWLLRSYKVIAVTGTHGKTTTTGMLGAGLIAAGLDPLVVVGATIPQWDGPIREGVGEYAVVEACEAYDSFHDLDPHIVLLTNLELDHKDYHGTYERLRGSVVKFVDKIPPEGCLVYCSEDRGASEVAELASTRAIPYGASAEWRRQVANIVDLPFETTEPLVSPNSLRLPGQHNLLNASGAAAVAALVDADLGEVRSALASFGGAERRLQVLQSDPVVVIDDYAHHPSEIVASLSALREKYFSSQESNSRLIVVFQPHLYSRTEGQYQEFAEALDLADEVVITDIYPAREDPLPGVSSAIIAELIQKPVTYIPNRFLLPRKVAERVRPGDVVVGMGAGTIGEFPRALIGELKRMRDLASGIRNLKVSVLYGGDSAEREVSLHSGIAARDALKQLGYSATLIDVSNALLEGKSLNFFAGSERPDVAFLAVHGTHAEDGALQGLLELLHIPYTGSGVLASATCLDKAATKRVLDSAGIRTPKGVVLSSPDDVIELSVPLIVKPNSQGSTVGLSFVRRAEELPHAVRRAFAYDDQVLVEEWIEGVEISVPVLANAALTPVEIAPISGKYDFSSKYVPGATEEIIPARIGPELLKEAKRLAESAHRILGCKGATRTDAIVRDGEIFVLEINTLPGLTPTSLLPNSAAFGGIPFSELCRMIVEDALEPNAKKANAY